MALSLVFAFACEGGDDKAAATKVTVTSAGNATEIEVGKTLQLTAKVAPDNASQEVVWSSGDETVATVANDGLVTAVKVGSVTVTATAKGSTVKGTVDLTVKEKGAVGSDDYSALPFNTHEEVNSAEKGTPLKVKGKVTYIASSSADEVSYYMQNGTEGFAIFGQSASKYPVQVGKVYAVGGVKKYYQGENEIVDIKYCEELSESVTVTEINLDDKDAGSEEATLIYQGAVVNGTATVTKAASVSATKDYGVDVTVNGQETKLYVKASKLEESEIAAINAKLASALPDVSIKFKGVLTHFGYGSTHNPEILIYKAADITVSEPAPQAKVDIVKNVLTVAGFVKDGVASINLPADSTAFAGVSISWSSDNTAIIANDGTVTHPANDTVVTLTATIASGGVSATKEFKVNVAGTNFNAELALGLDFEDAAPAGQYGTSSTKASYQNKEGGEVTDAANTVKLGGNDWILNGALIASEAGGDHANGVFAARVTKNEGSKIETTVADDYRYIEFNLATYGQQNHGTVVTVQYKLADGDWVETNMYMTANTYTLETYRIALAEGVKQVRIYVVGGSGNINIDDVKLYK